MEKRRIKISENLDGHGSLNYRISLPKKWIEKIFENIEGEKFATLQFDEKHIILKKD